MIHMSILETYKNGNIDLSVLGLNRGPKEGGYFCTPVGAKVFGWAGVDGIHYCTIEGQGDTVFAVSPMNFGDYVHPIAGSFEDLLRMLLSCHSMDALEQCYAWAEDQFKAYLIDYPATEEIIEKQKQILDTFHLEPMEDVFGYIKQLQDNYDMSTIRYSEEYYETLGIEQPNFEECSWKVTFEGGFWSNEGKAGREIRVDKTFLWGEEKWYVPAVYLCEEGIVIDYCKEAEPEAIRAFIEKWDLLNEHKNHYSKEQRDQISLEHPLAAHLGASVIINGNLLREDHGCGLSWIPSALVDDPRPREDDARKIMDHYYLDPEKAWSLNRCSFKWTDAPIADISEMEIRMETRDAKIPGPRFETHEAGKIITFQHPITGIEHCLTVQELDHQELSQTHFRDESMEYPTHFVAMTYTIEPEIDKNHIMILDCADGDRARRRTDISQEKECVPVMSASAIGVIGSADGPTAILVGNVVPRTLHAACSAVHFEKVDFVEWRIVFREKLKEDIQIKLI